MEYLEDSGKCKHGVKQTPDKDMRCNTCYIEEIENAARTFSKALTTEIDRVWELQGVIKSIKDHHSPSPVFPNECNACAHPFPCTTRKLADKADEKK